MDSLTIQSKVVGPVKNPNCKFTFVQVVKLLLLFPFFSVKNAADYANSCLGKKQKAAQYTKERAEDEKENIRKAEMMESKNANAIKMIRRAIVEGIRFDYLLVDSWFPCAELLRSIGYHYAFIKSNYAGMDVVLFFYRKGNGSWNALISTDTGIDAKEAFSLYSRRWVIEVAHKEMKGLLNLGKCQCIDFAGQIAGLSLCMIQYNILGCVKRFETYETIGGLFAKVTGETVELSVTQRIWGLIVEVINVIAGFIACDPFELIENAINNNNQIKAVKQAFDRLDLAGAAA